ncbi:MAG: hypothetical protein V1917_01625 [Candidatus Gottesmanbacteria bacterium]
MPGNKLYQVSRLIERIKKYWSWGMLAQTKYQLSLSDKYLVEAKTLFEYRQYLLGVSALQRSNDAFDVLPALVTASKKEGKSIVNMAKIIADAGMEHERVLEEMKMKVPGSFTWSPEQERSTELSLHSLVQKAIELRASRVAEIKTL